MKERTHIAYIVSMYSVILLHIGQLYAKETAVRRYQNAEIVLKKFVINQDHMTLAYDISNKGQNEICVCVEVWPGVGEEVFVGYSDDDISRKLKRLKPPPDEDMIREENELVGSYDNETLYIRRTLEPMRGFRQTPMYTFKCVRPGETILLTDSFALPVLACHQCMPQYYHDRNMLLHQLHIEIEYLLLPKDVRTAIQDYENEKQIKGRHQIRNQEEARDILWWGHTSLGPIGYLGDNRILVTYPIAGDLWAKDNENILRISLQGVSVPYTEVDPNVIRTGARVTP